MRGRNSLNIYLIMNEFKNSLKIGFYQSFIQKKIGKKLNQIFLISLSLSLKS